MQKKSQFKRISINDSNEEFPTNIIISLQYRFDLQMMSMICLCVCVYVSFHSSYTVVLKRLPCCTINTQFKIYIYALIGKHSVNCANKVLYSILYSNGKNLKTKKRRPQLDMYNNIGSIFNFIMGYSLYKNEYVI